MRNSLLILSILFCIAPARAEFDFDAYQQSGFAEIKAAHAEDLLKASREGDYAVSAATFKYRMPVIFTKDLRKLSGNNRTVIKAWQTSLRVPAGFVELYQHEFRAEFGGETYWIPVQEKLLLPMGSELHPGDKFELYVVLIGAINSKPVFLATEFKSDREPQ